VSDLGVFRNEFAMVRLMRLDGPTGTRLVIRDLGSGAEVAVDPLELEGLTRIHHSEFAPLLDPSGLVAAEEPDPDQV
jgi:hypothetical protein